MSERKDYKVLVPFRDLKDKSKEFPDGKRYAIGDIYSNTKATDKRIKELSTNKNKLGKKIIKPISNISDLTVKELEGIAKKRNIEGYSNLNKKELIEVLEGD